MYGIFTRVVPVIALICSFQVVLSIHIVAELIHDAVAHLSQTFLKVFSSLFIRRPSYLCNLAVRNVRQLTAIDTARLVRF